MKKRMFAPTRRLPQLVTTFFWRRCMEVAGVVIGGMALFLATALIGYDRADPSANVASDAAIANPLGLIGSTVADLLIQLFGLASGWIVVLLSVYAWQLACKQIVGRWRLMAAMASVVLLSVFCATFSAPAWHNGLGGIIGYTIKRFGQASLDVFILPYMTVGLSLIAFVAVASWSFFIGWRQWWGFALGTYTSVAYGVWRLFDHQVHDDRPSRFRPSVRPSVTKISSRAGRQMTLLPVGRGKYMPPPLHLLTRSERLSAVKIDDRAFAVNADLLLVTLNDFGVKGKITNVRPGPIVTLYEFVPSPGTKASRVIGLADDIARSMSAVSARIATISGSNSLGIELPNTKRATVMLRELLGAEEFVDQNQLLPLALGKDIGGVPLIVDLATMPHLLVAGTTGSGKSVAINAMVLSLLYKLGPDACKLIMIDPKMLELSVYDGIPHLIAPVVVEPKQAIVALKWTVREMESRYQKMSALGVRSIAAYDQKRRRQASAETESKEDENMPLIVVIVDEMADLMMTAGKDIEVAMQRLSQMARAAGIHIIMATQRPSVDVVTGVIKANFPTRISFQVTSKIDSRTVLGDGGAEQLLGKGDMLYMSTGGRIVRAHGPFVNDGEVEGVVNYLKKKYGAPQYIEEVTKEPEGEDGLLESDGGDDLYRQAVECVREHKRASTSFIQRRLQIGYNRAARLVEKMEEDGIIGPANHVGKRDILV